MSSDQTGGWSPPSDPFGAPAPPPPPPPPPGYGYPPPSTGGNERTGPLVLAPMGIGEILDGAVKLYRANFKAIALVALVVMGPIQVISAVAVRSQLGGTGVLDMVNDPSLAEPGNTPFSNVGPTLLTLAFYAVGFLFTPIVAGAVAKAVATSYVGGSLTAGEVLRAAGRRWWQLIVASILVHICELFGMLGFCIGALFVMPLFVVVSPAIVVEELGPLEGIKRSWNLCTSRYMAVLGVAVLSGVITWLAKQIVAVPFSIPAAFIGFRWGFLLVAVGGIVTEVFVAPISAIVATLVYFDLRIRREGFDLQVMAANLADR
jgi:hypothetical protein